MSERADDGPNPISGQGDGQKWEQAWRDDGASAAPLVSCRDVARTYGAGLTAVVAVHGANCDIWPNDRVAVIGSSGSGKSTLLHLLAGLERPTVGSLTFPALATTGSSIDLSTGGLSRRFTDIGVVFQGPSLIAGLNVLENVALPLVLSAQPDTKARQAAHNALDRLDIKGLADMLPEELSGGQAQRVAVARVLAARPRLILADEPTGQLDHDTAGHVIEVLVDAADELGAALLIATHDRELASRMRRIWLMDDGRLHPGVPGVPGVPGGPT